MTVNLSKQIIWWTFFLVCFIYSAYALDLARVQVAALLGLNVEEGIKVRAAPIGFLIHTLLGSIGLLCGILQLNQRILKKNRKIHRIIGWTYLLTIWSTSISGFWNALFFDVPILAKIVFLMISTFWFCATTIAYLRIRAGRIQEHREWMIRSFAISFFFVTFSLWVPTLLAIMPEEIAWPIGLALAASLNLLVAEIWIRRSRSQISKVVVDYRVLST